MVTVPLSRIKTNAARPVFDQGNVPSGVFDTGGTALVKAGQQIEGFGNTIGDFKLKMIKEDNEAEAKDADTRVSQAIRNIVFGDPSNNVQGYLSQKGKNATDNFSITEQALNKSVEDIIGGASNDAVKLMIKQASDRRLGTAFDSVVKHAGAERDASFIQTSLAREAQALADVSADFSNPETLRQGLGVARVEVLERANQQGWSDEQAEAALRQSQSVIVKGAFDAALVSEDVDTATRIFSANADLLDGPTRTTMAQSLAKDTLSTGSQRLAEEAISKFPSDPAAQRDYIRSVSSGGAESAAIKELKERIAEVRRDKTVERGKKAEARAVAGERRSVRAAEVAMQNAMRQELDRGRPARAQAAVENAIDTLGPNATDAQVRELLQDELEGQDEEAALSLYQTRVDRDRGDTSVNRGDDRASLPDRASEALKRIVAEGKSAQDIREEIAALGGGELQEAVFSLYEAGKAAERRDAGDERLIVSQERAAKVQSIVTDIQSRGLTPPQEREAILAEVDPGKDTDYALSIYARDLDAARGDDALVRTVQSDARAKQNNMNTVARLERERVVREAREDIYNFLYNTDGGDGERTVAEFRKANPEAFNTLAQSRDIDAAINTQRNIKEGQIFATVSDGVTLPKDIVGISIAERAKLDPIVYRSRLTRTEFNSAVRSIESAKRELRGDARDRSVFSAGRAAVMRMLPQQIAKARTDSKLGRQRLTTMNEMNNWVDNRIAEDNYPTPQEIEREAARLSMVVEADPAGFIDRVNRGFDGLASQRRSMSPEQRAVAVVDIEVIPEIIMQNILNALAIGRVPENDDLVENLAGALAMKDKARYDKLIEDSYRKERAKENKARGR